MTSTLLLKWAALVVTSIINAQDRPMGDFAVAHLVVEYPSGFV